MPTFGIVRSDLRGMRSFVTLTKDRCKLTRKPLQNPALNITSDRY